MGDFQIGEVGYVNKTLQELEVDMAFYEKGWSGDAEIQGIFGVRDSGVNAREEAKKLTREERERERRVELRAERERERAIRERKEREETERRHGDKEGREVEAGNSVEKENISSDQDPTPQTESIPEPTTQETETTAEDPTPEAQNAAGKTTQFNAINKRKQIKNVVVLGLGSLQNARREGRRTSWTQLIALRHILSILGTIHISNSFFPPTYQRIPTNTTQVPSQQPSKTLSSLPSIILS